MHFETWLELASAGQFDGQGDHHTPKPYVRQAFRKYLECGIFAHGFARAWCDDCGHDYFVAYSCKGRGVCPSCNTRRMVETAAHLSDHGAAHLLAGHRANSADPQPPRISPARVPPLWDDCGDALAGEGTQIGPDWAISWDVAAQPVPD